MLTSRRSAPSPFLAALAIVLLSFSLAACSSSRDAASGDDDRIAQTLASLDEAVGLTHDQAVQIQKILVAQEANRRSGPPPQGAQGGQGRPPRGGQGGQGGPPRGGDDRAAEAAEIDRQIEAVLTPDQIERYRAFRASRRNDDRRPEPTSSNSLSEGPRSPGPHGPFSASDVDRDGQVTRAEIEAFISMGPERGVGLVAYFGQFDADSNQVLDEAEVASVEPAFAFDGADANADGTLTLDEVTSYANERIYRTMGLDDFFDLIDTNRDSVVSAEEIEAAHVSGQLPRG